MSTPTTPAESPTITFETLGLSAPVLKAIREVGYETPTPIQAGTIPPLLEGRDMVGQAQTGTGKTAAFALPILSRIDAGSPQTQALVLAPTRELAIQVAEAFQKYASHLRNFHVLPIYGGQSYEPQLRGLKRGAQVVVGTPGRVVDHLKRGTLRLDGLVSLVLDEADEMLRMGFIDDVEWILEQTPPTRQVALFSATLPEPIRKIAKNHLRTPAEITIKTRTTTAANIRQSYWMVSGMQKLDALTRILEAESFDGMIVFTRTKISTEELAERLEARGFAASALNGDMAQQQRERTVSRFKEGMLDILVATDVAARGLDVDRVSHVINYDIPTDVEAYVHRVGRTGRAGRTGEAILFVTPRERFLLKAIERATRQPIEHRAPPSAEAINTRRIQRFKQAIMDAMSSPNLSVFRALVEEYETENNVPAADIAAALACVVQGDKPMLMHDRGQTGASHHERASERPPRPERTERPERAERSERPARAERPERPKRAATETPPRRSEPPITAERPVSLDMDDDDFSPAHVPPPDEPLREKKRDASDLPPMETYRLEVGRVHGVKPGNIVGALANEAGLDAEYIGRIDIREDHSLVDLPEGMPKATFRDLQKTRVAGQALRISKAGEAARVRAPRPTAEADDRRPPMAPRRPHSESREFRPDSRPGMDRRTPASDRARRPDARPGSDDRRPTLSHRGPKPAGATASRGRPGDRRPPSRKPPRRTP